MQLNYQTIYSDRKTIQLSVERDRKVIVRAQEEHPEKRLKKLLKGRNCGYLKKLSTNKNI